LFGTSADTIGEHVGRPDESTEDTNWLEHVPPGVLPLTLATVQPGNVPVKSPAQVDETPAAVPIVRGAAGPVSVAAPAVNPGTLPALPVVFWFSVETEVTPALVIETGPLRVCGA
jgi:hypothetical protein